jgi:hypothetical protein
MLSQVDDLELGSARLAGVDRRKVKFALLRSNGSGLERFLSVIELSISLLCVTFASLIDSRCAITNARASTKTDGNRVIER